MDSLCCTVLDISVTSLLPAEVGSIDVTIYPSGERIPIYLQCYYNCLREKGYENSERAIVKHINTVMNFRFETQSNFNDILHPSFKKVLR